MKHTVLLTLLCVSASCNFSTIKKLKECVLDAIPFGINKVRLGRLQKKEIGSCV